MRKGHRQQAGRMDFTSGPGEREMMNPQLEAVPHKRLPAGEAETKRKIPPFEESLRAILSVAREEVMADGYALYEWDEACRALAPRMIHGLAPRKPDLDAMPRAGGVLLIAARGNGSPTLLSLTLPGEGGIAGVLDFGFAHPRPLGERQRMLISRTADLAGRILQAGRERVAAVRAAKRIAELEFALADRKIVDRARGLARHPSLPDRADTLFAHAGRVLETPRIGRHLAAYEQEGEARLQARSVVTEAKLWLQKRFGLPEDEAYLTLREYSRRTRTALSTVAREILEGRLELPGLRSRLTA